MIWTFLCILLSWCITILVWLVTRTNWDELDGNEEKTLVTLWMKLCEYCTLPFSWAKRQLLRYVNRQGAGINAELLRHSGFSCVDAVQNLVNDGADVNAKDEVSGHTALMISTANGHSDVTRFLVKAGADVNARDKNCQSSLMIAARVGYSDIVKYLVEAGADVNAQDIFGRSALWLSAWYGHMDIVKYLIRAGAHVNVKGKREDTGVTTSAIAMATEFGHKETVLALIGAGANISSNIDGRTLLDIAATNGQKDVFLALRAAGATENRYNFIPMLEACIRDGHLDMSQLLGNLLADDDVNRSDILRMLEKIPYQDSISNVDSLRAQLLLYDKLKIPLTITESSMPFQDAIDYGIDTAQRKQGFLLTDTYTLPEDIASLPNVSDLIRCPGIGNIDCLPNGTAEVISNFTYDFVQSTIVDNLNSDIETEHQHGGLSAYIVRCGSAAEGTKTVVPDEFDYDITFKIDREAGEVVDFRHNGRDDGYKLYQAKSGKASNTMKTWANCQMKGSKIFHIEFFDRLIKTTKAVENIQIGSMVKGGGQPNTAITIVWNEPETNHKLQISVDLVPVLQFAGEWPEYLTQRTWMMDREQLKSRGYCLVAKPPHADSLLGKAMREIDQEYERTQLWRISFSHLEAEHIAALPSRVRDAYVAAKCLRNPDVCRIRIRDKDGILNNVDKYVSSYMLKTVFLHKAEDLLNMLNSEKPLNVLEMVEIIYTDLEHYLEKEFLPLFWLPEANHIAGMKGDPKKALRVTKLMREFVGRLKTREMDTDTGGTKQKLTEQSRLLSDTDPLKFKNGKEVPTDIKPNYQCLPALCPLGYYVIPESDVATG